MTSVSVASLYFLGCLEPSWLLGSIYSLLILICLTCMSLRVSWKVGFSALLVLIKNYKVNLENRYKYLGRPMYVYIQI